MTDTPFKAGETIPARLLEVDFAPGNAADGSSYVTFEVPNDDARWIAGWYTLRPDSAPAAPTPPADDLAPARAEARNAALEEVATALQYGPTLRGDEAAALIRKHKKPLSPPDAKPAPKAASFDEQAAQIRDALYAEQARGNLPPAPERERLKGWVNLYPYGAIYHYLTREEADYGATSDRIACIDLSQHFVGEGLEP